MNNFATSCLKALRQVVYPCEPFGWNRNCVSRLSCSEFGQTRPQGAFPCLSRWGGKSAPGTRLEVGEKRTLVRLLASDRRFDEMQYRTKTASHTQLEKKIYSTITGCQWLCIQYAIRIYLTEFLKKLSNTYVSLRVQLWRAIWQLFIGMGSESIAHEAEDRMGYRLIGHDRLIGHEGERNNCFSKIQPVGEKYRE